MNTLQNSFYELHRKDGELYITKERPEGFSLSTCILSYEKVSSRGYIVERWVYSWNGALPTSITITPVREGVWLVSYTVAEMLRTQDFLMKSAAKWKESAERKRQCSNPSESFLYVKACILTEMYNIGYIVSDGEVHKALIAVDYPSFYG